VDFQVRRLDSAVLVVPLQEHVLILGYKSKPSMVISRSLLVPSSFTTCAFLVCWDASYGPGYLITEGHVQVTFECLIWELFLGGSSAIFTLAKFLKWT
jgi:hypothetical protein